MAVILGKCPICTKHDLTDRVPRLTGTKHVECPLCGPYRITDMAIKCVIQNNELLERIHMFSGLLRNFNARSPTNETIEVRSEMMTSWDGVKERAPIPIPDDLDIVGKAEAVMQAIRGRADGRLNRPLVFEESTGYVLGFCHDAEEFLYLIAFAESQNWIECKRPATRQRQYQVQLTPEGWARLAGIGNISLDQGFIAMSFADTFLPLYINGLAPGIEAAGYKAIRIDRTDHNNKIDDEIVAEIRKARFVVADLTTQNPGAYFEAGLAKGLGKEVFWTCKKSEVDAKTVHFDTRQYVITTWVEGAYEDHAANLRRRIEATIGRGKYQPSPKHPGESGANP